MNTWLTEFVDETGTNELEAEKPGTSHLFICVGILVDDKGLARRRMPANDNIPKHEIRNSEPAWSILDQVP